MPVLDLLFQLVRANLLLLHCLLSLSRLPSLYWSILVPGLLYQSQMNEVPRIQRTMPY